MILLQCQDCSTCKFGYNCLFMIVYIFKSFVKSYNSIFDRNLGLYLKVIIFFKKVSPKMYELHLQDLLIIFCIFSCNSCVQIQEHQASDIEIYHCPNCQTVHGPLVCEYIIILLISTTVQLPDHT